MGLDSGEVWCMLKAADERDGTLSRSPGCSVRRPVSEFRWALGRIAARPLRITLMIFNRLNDLRSNLGDRRAFTLTELLVVIALIVLLVALLLAALNTVQKKAKEVATTATMTAFSGACDAFQMEHGFYPGIVPETILTGYPLISGTENALLHLTGGFAREDDDPAGYADLVGGWTEIQFGSGSDTYKIKHNRAHIGNGPIINGKPYAPYFTPGEKDFGVTEGQDGAGQVLPDVLDAWGQPIIYVRRTRSSGTLAETSSSLPVQYSMASMTPYLSSNSLGKLGGDQGMNSILNTAPDPERTFAALLGHPAMTDPDAVPLVGPARGAYMLLSAGADGIYFSHTDGPGTGGAPVDDLFDAGDAFYKNNPHIFDEYDDVVMFGGD